MLRLRIYSHLLLLSLMSLTLAGCPQIQQALGGKPADTPLQKVYRLQNDYNIALSVILWAHDEGYLKGDAFTSAMAARRTAWGSITYLKDRATAKLPIDDSDAQWGVLTQALADLATFQAQNQERYDQGVRSGHSLPATTRAAADGGLGVHPYARGSSPN